MLLQPYKHNEREYERECVFGMSKENQNIIVWTKKALFI